MQVLSDLIYRLLQEDQIQNAEQQTTWPNQIPTMNKNLKKAIQPQSLPPTARPFEDSHESSTYEIYSRQRYIRQSFTETPHSNYTKSTANYITPMISFRSSYPWATSSPPQMWFYYLAMSPSRKQ
jgi:hypothetical protein